MFRRNAIATVAVTALVVTAAATGASAAAPSIQPAGTTSASGAGDQLSVGQLAKLKKLHDDEALVRGTPGPAGHAYTFNTTTAYWSVVAALPEFNFDVDLHLYADKARTELLAQSEDGWGSPDFIAINSYRRPLDDYYALVDRAENRGKYGVELAQGSRAAGDGTVVVPLLGDNFITVYDTVMQTGHNYRFVLAPGTEDMNGTLYLMGSTDDPKTWVQPKAAAIKTSFGSDGKATILDFSPQTTARYGLVIISKGDPGSFTLTRVQY